MVAPPGLATSARPERCLHYHRCSRTPVFSLLLTREHVSHLEVHLLFSEDPMHSSTKECSSRVERSTHTATSSSQELQEGKAEFSANPPEQILKSEPAFKIPVIQLIVPIFAAMSHHIFRRLLLFRDAQPFSVSATLCSKIIE